MHPQKTKAFFALLLLLPFSAHAFSSPNVPVDDPVYRDLDKLAAFGLVKDAIYGQRPWSRGEIARMIGEAMRNAPDETAGSLLKKLAEEFKDELDGHAGFRPLNYAEPAYTFLDQERRSILNNGLGAVDAFVEPFLANQEGRHFPDGHQFSLETEHFLGASRYFSFYARPRFEADVTHHGDGGADLFVQQFYGKFTIKNFEIEAGRDSIEWGQGEFGGILLSNNARPLDMIKLSNPSPTILPWLFKYMGPVRYTFFVANLGPEREFPYSYLTGLKISLKPASFFEVGIDQIIVLGGRGAPGPSALENIFRGFFANTSGNNRELGFDLRLWIPPLRHSQIYLDTQFEDKEFGTPGFMFTDLASYQAGIYIPRLNPSGTMDLRLEYRHGSPFFYRHGGFTTGMALNQYLLGDSLGPEGDGVSLTFYDRISPNLRFVSTMGYERRDGDTLSQIEDPDSRNRHLQTDMPTPAENRLTWKLTGTLDLSENTKLTITGGYQRILSFNFSNGDDRNAFLGSLRLRFHFF